MTTQRSIYEIKSEFLASQTRTLSRTPDPPKDWLQNVEATELGDISDSVLNQVLYKRMTFAKALYVTGH